MTLENYASPEDSLKYLFNITDPAHYNFDDFWYCWTNRRSYFQSLNKKLTEFNSFLANSFYTSQIPQTKLAQEILSQVRILIDKLDILYGIAQKPKGFFKKRKSVNAITEGNKKLVELKKLLPELHILVGQIHKQYPRTLEEKLDALQRKYPYFQIKNFEDYEHLLRFEQESIFTYKIFRLLDRYVFLRIFNKRHPITVSRISLLLQKLDEKRKNKIYLYNLRRSIKLRIIIGGEHSVYYFQPEDIFFDTQFFDMAEFWFHILNNSYIPNNWSWGLSQLANWLEENRRSNNQNANDLAYKSLKKLVSTKIQIEPEAFLNRGSVIFPSILTEGMVEILSLFDIRKFHNLGEADLLKTLIPIFIEHQDFKVEKALLANLWAKTIKKSCRDIYHMVIFIKLYHILGINFFNELIKRKIVLSSSDINDLEVTIENEQKPDIDNK